MAKNSSWPVTGSRIRGLLKVLKDSKLILKVSYLFPWSSRISLEPFRTFRGPLFSKPVTGQELFLAVSYNKPALPSAVWKVLNMDIIHMYTGTKILNVSWKNSWNHIITNWGELVFGGFLQFETSVWGRHRGCSTRGHHSTSLHIVVVTSQWIVSSSPWT